MGIYSNYVIENNSLSLLKEDNKDLSKYLDESFLAINESSGINDLTNRIKVLTRKIENEEITEDEIKEEIQDIYDQAQYILKGAAHQSQAGTVFAIIGCVGIIATFISAAVEFAPGMAVSIGLSMLSFIIAGIVWTKQDYDKFYTILVRAESEIMRELRIAKQEGDQKKIKSCEKVIEVYEELKSKRRTELNQRAHDYYNYQNESADVVLEYMGNEIKTNNMIQTFADIDHYLKYELETLNVFADHVDNMISIANKATKKNISEITKKCVDEGNKINEDINKVRDTWFPMSENMFRKEIKVFSNKYSKLGMEQREKFSAKLEKYLEKVNEIGNKYDKNSDIKAKVDELSDKVKTIDYANGEKIISLIYNWVNDGVIEHSNYIIGICAYLIKALNVKGIKASLMYKIAGKFGK